MEGGTSQSSTGDSSFVPSNLTALVPSFDPSTDDVETWTKKVELLAKVWPKEKLSELSTRLILNTKGSAFQKLQIKQDELLKNDMKSIQALVSIVGGQFGQVPLERRYEHAEKALFRCQQRADESNDSYLARTDVAWTEVLTRNVKLEELQAYVLLRGSLLSAEDKRVVVEAGAETGGQLTVAKVSSAIRMLGAGFFQEYMGLKKSKQKIYDQSAFVTEELEPDMGDALVTQEEDHEDEFLDGLLQEGDEDAILITEYEAAINDTIQGDAELATALNAYTDARRRLSERFRNRGFWPTRPSKSSGKGKGFKSKRDFSGKGRKSLQDRILSSRCRICNKVGHWKAECPERKSAASGSVPTANVSLAEVAQPSSSPNDALLLEFMTLPEIDAEKPIDVPLFDTPEVSFLTLSEALKGITNRVNGVIYSPRGNQFRNDRQAIVTLPNRCDPPSNSDDFSGETANSADVHFASHGSFGVVDLGASKTVIGSKHIPDLLKSFDPSIREKLRRCPCQMQFRFGNQGVLCSEQALLVPVGQLVVKIAIVPGNTPFLISNSFLRGMQAIVDTHKARLISPLLNQSIELHLSPRGLFLMDLNQVIRAAKLSKSSLKPETVCTTITIEEKDPVRVWNPPQEVNSGVCKISTTVKSRNDPHKPDRVGFQHVDSATNRKEFNGQPGALQTISKSDPVAASQVVSRHVRFDSSPQADPEASASGTSRHLALQAGGPDGHEDNVRVNTCGQKLRAHVEPRAIVDHVVHPEVRQIVQIGAQVGHPIRRDESSPPREPRNDHACAAVLEGHDDVDAEDIGERSARGISQSQGQDINGQGKHQYSASWTPIDDRACRRVRISDGRVVSPEGRLAGSSRTICEPSRCTGPSEPYAESRECPATGDHSPPGSDSIIQDGGSIGNWNLGEWESLMLAGDPDHLEENIYQTEIRQPQRSSFQTAFDKSLHKITVELQGFVDKMKQSPKVKNELMEVFCHHQSRLTQQVINLGGKAMRYSKVQGDLMTEEGRFILFKDLLEYPPEHVWYSPECGPWSAWSNLNSAKSCAAWDSIHSKRLANMDQLALGVVLLRYQRAHGRHFHWEQPSRSNMFRTPLLQELYTKTVAAEFDMCNLAELRDPVNQKLIKKGMVIMTTSQKMQSDLHGHHCRKDHEHQPLEGSTQVQGRNISRTSFSEEYPRKFARRVAKVILHHEHPKELPVFWNSHEIHASQVDDPQPKRRRLTSQRLAARLTIRRKLERVPKDELSSQTETEEKRRRITGKGGNRGTLILRKVTTKHGINFS